MDKILKNPIFFTVSVAFLEPNFILSLTQTGKLSLNGRLLHSFEYPEKGLFTSLSVCCIILSQKCWIICVTSMHEISLWLLEEGEGYYSVVVPLAFLCLDSSSPNGGKPLCSSVHRSSTNVRKDEREERSKKVTLLIGHDDGFYRKVVGDIIGKTAFYFIFLHSGPQKNFRPVHGI